MAMRDDFEWALEKEPSLLSAATDRERAAPNRPGLRARRRRFGLNAWQCVACGGSGECVCVVSK